MTPRAGVGLDFQTTLVEGIMKVRGANYFSVHTAGEELWSAFLSPHASSDLLSRIAHPSSGS